MFELVTCIAASHFFLTTGYRSQMLSLLKPISKSKQNGMSITSCYAHCQAQYQVMWHADNSTLIGTKVSLIQNIY